MVVCLEQRVFAGKCADQHQQSGLRQMKVSEQRADDLKFVPRVNEDLGFDAARLYSSRTSRRIFQGADRRGANRYDAPSPIQRTINPGRRFF